MAGQTINNQIKISENDNVLLNVSEDVAATVDKTENLSVLEAHGEEVFYQTAEFWVGFAFILVVVLLFKPLGKMLKSMLVKRRSEIIDQITQAEHLRDDAQKLLAQYEKKFLHAKDEANEILERSEKEIELLKNDELQKLEQDLEIRRKEVENSIALSAEKVRNEINKTIASLAVDKVKKHIHTHLTPADHEKLIDASLDKVIKKFSSVK